MKIRLVLTFMLALTILPTGCSEAKQKRQKEQRKEIKTMKTKELTAEEFKNKIMDYEKNPQKWEFKGNLPAIIDFYATWCGPCKATAPILDSLAEEYDGQLDIYKVDVDKEQELATMFGIRSVPSILFIPKEGTPKIQVGAMSKMQFEEVIKSDLLK